LSFFASPGPDLVTGPGFERNTEGQSMHFTKSRRGRLSAAAGFALLVCCAAGSAPAQTSGLKTGEYACFSGGRVLIGLGFKVTVAGQYTDLDGKSRGRFTVNGSRVEFHGGHLDGQVGSNLNKGTFQIGAIGCEPS
jgi:hypothetical protein